ncbi:MAG: ABC transporter ATP-binding protein [Eubacterium sp.]|nr:ABC transporter ATP-binding protein [Eubacterium sp.]
MSYILQTSHLGKRIGSRELVKDVDIHVSQGEIYGFLGPNGAGKTTVMKMITNLWKPTTGTVQLFGRTLEHNSYEVFQRMGSIIEFPVFYEHMTGKENLQLHCEYMGYYCQGSVEEALRLLHLTDAADKPVAGYSLGMKQRLGIARAVLHRPQLVILDEPSNGLDPAGMKQMRDLFQMLCKEYGMTFLISSHLLSEMENMADTIGVIQDGKMLKEISMKELEEMNSAYIELAAENTKRAAYVLAEIMHYQNFKIFSNSKIRVYEKNADIQKIAEQMVANEAGLISINQHARTLEEYFLNLTSQAGRAVS